MQHYAGATARGRASHTFAKRNRFTGRLSQPDAINQFSAFAQCYTHSQGHANPEFYPYAKGHAYANCHSFCNAARRRSGFAYTNSEPPACAIAYWTQLCFPAP